MDNNYNRVIGYSPLEDVDEAKMLQVIRVNKKIVEAYYPIHSAGLALVAGAGQGQEAVLIHREFGMATVGVDLNIAPVQMLNAQDDVFLQRQNIARLAFAPETFSLIYSYHVLEHVDDPVSVLQELERVLRPGGVLFIGFPNKNRLFSYIGTSQKVSSLDKLKWNLNDYWGRLKGKFENRYGAHAGFTEKEFLSMAVRVFDVVKPVRDQYMLYKYAKQSKFIELLIQSNLNEFFFPSNYYVCLKQAH